MRLALVLFTLLAFGCAASGPVQLSPDTYIIARTDKNGIFGDAARMKVAVIREANEFAQSIGKVAIPISSNETPMRTGRFAAIEYQFRVVDPNDPEHQRTSLTKAPDKIIETRQSVNVRVDDAARTEAETKSLHSRLVDLEDLRKRGILTDQEFEVENKKILETN